MIYTVSHPWLAVSVDSVYVPAINYPGMWKL